MVTYDYEPADSSVWWIEKPKGRTEQDDYLPSWSPPAGDAASIACPALHYSPMTRTFGTTWLAGRLVETETRSASGDDAYRKTTYSQHDKYGNAKKTVTEAAQATARSTLTTYYTNGYFVYDVTDGVGITADSRFEAGYGKPIAMRAMAGGPLTVITYDWLGRERTRTSDETPPVEQRIIGSTEPCVAYVKRTAQAGSPERYEAFDRLERLVSTRTAAFDPGSSKGWIETATRYNVRGLKVAESAPRFVSTRGAAPAMTCTGRSTTASTRWAGSRPRPCSASTRRTRG